MYLKLRGLCPDSNIDQFYVPRNKPGSNAFQLIGFKNTIIEYKGPDVGWELKVNGLLQNPMAITESPLESYVLGSHHWNIRDDNFECSKKGEPYSRVLKLTGCREGEFTCSDGQCIRGQTLMYQTRAECKSNRVFRNIQYMSLYARAKQNLEVNFWDKFCASHQGLELLLP